MAKRIRIVPCTLLALVLIAGVSLTFRSLPVKEPVYQGRPLGQWLDAPRNSPVPTKLMAEVGTNAIPWLIHETSAHEYFWMIWVKEKITRLSGGRIHFMSAAHRQYRARWGFEGLGAAGEMALAQGLTNSDKWIRIGCLVQWNTGQWHKDTYVPAMVNCLHDPDPMVRTYAAGAVGMVRQQPEKAIPILTQLLKDPNENVRYWAKSALDGYAAAGFVTNTLQSIGGAPK